MHTEPDVTRIVRSWLHEDEHDSADRVLAAVLADVDTTPQRRAWWPAWRVPSMNTYAKLALAAAAVLVVAIVGINLVPGSRGGVGGPAASPSPSPSPSASPRPALLLGGALAAGTYLLDEAQFTRRPFTVTVPKGWYRDVNDGNFVAKGAGSDAGADAFEGNGVTMATWLVSHVYADSCRWQETLREVGSATDLTTALTEQTGHVTTGPTDVSLGGYPATRFEFSVPVGFDVGSCDSEIIRLWPDAGPNEDFGLPIAVGQTTTVYVVDLDGQAQLIIGARKGDSSPSDVGELEQVIESIRFEAP